MTPQAVAILGGAKTELVANGLFSFGDLAGWTDASSAGATISAVSGQAVVTNSASQAARLRQTILTIAGRSYALTATGTSWNVSVGTTAGGSDLLSAATVAQTRQFTATNQLTWLNFSSTTNGAVLDNISLRQVFP